MRGAWVEIAGVSMANHKTRRSPCGERGLKSLYANDKKQTELVAPRAGSVG